MQLLHNTVPITETGCLLWEGYVNNRGYGILWKAGKRWKAHRYAYILAHGAIPEGMCVCHKCDVRSCVNPEHLFLGTQADNMHDMDNKDRRREEPSYFENWNSSVPISQARDMLWLQSNRWSNRAIGRRYGVSHHVVRRATVAYQRLMAVK